MRNFIQPGKALTVVALTAVVSGSLIVAGKVFGIAATSAPAGAEFELETGGVYELPKVAADVWVFGDEIYADASGIATKEATGNTKIGVAVESVVAGTGLGRVRLNDNF